MLLVSVVNKLSRCLLKNQEHDIDILLAVTVSDIGTKQGTFLTVVHVLSNISCWFGKY